MKKYLTVMLCCASFTAFSQKTAPDFTIPTGNFINQANFLKQSDIGMLIVSTPSGLIGIDPRKKTKAWETKEVKNIMEDEFKVIPGTQYIMVEFQKETALTKNKTVAIFDSYTGKMAYNSRNEDIKVRNTRIVPELKGILIEGVRDDQYFIGFLDFATSAVTWTKSFGKIKTGGIGIGALSRAIKSHLESVFDVTPVTDNDGNFIFSNKKDVFCLNGKTGVQKWTRSFDDEVTDFAFTKDKKELFIVYDDKVEKLNTATAKASYSEPIKVKGRINGILPIENDAYAIMHSDGMNVLEANGTLRWKKDASAGNISMVWPVADGFIALEKNEKNGKVFKIGSEGKSQWNESLSDPVYTVKPISAGVIYITTEKANILSYDKGKDFWKKDIKIKGNPAFGTDNTKNIVYVYSNKSLSAFNLQDGTYRTIAEELKLKDYDDEKETAIIEQRGDNILIYTNQNVALVKPDGTIIYNKFFTEAGLSKLARGLLSGIGSAAQVGGIAAIGAGAMKPQDMKVTGSYYDPATNRQTYEVTSKQLETGAAVFEGGDAMYNFAQARYYATQTAQNTVYVLSKWSEGTGLVVVDKNSGNEVKRIVFNDKTPQYIVDEADYKVYVLVGGKELSAYSLK